ncbi:MAG: hypothetical protein M1821_005658 [Bathelium mastoideum]|nr:MAG: hypothetical protein M1821_005658 [Bathelium mastoideum]
MGIFIWGLAVALLCYTARLLFDRVRYERALQRNHCTKPAAYPHRDPFLGIDLFLEVAKSFKAGTFLETNKRHYEEYGKTFEANSWGVRFIKTIQPEIMETVYASSFKNFGLEPLRLDVGYPFFGKGILVTDGPFWEHSRALIRPTFTRAKFANFKSLEQHVTLMIDHIPKDGSTVDLQPLFKRLFLDTSSEFIFGKSINSLSPDAAIDGQEFIRAFEYAHRGVGTRVMLGKARYLVPDKKWHQACKTVHDYCDKYVVQALSKPKSAPAILDKNMPEKWILLDEMAKETRDPLDLRYQILNIFSPGHDATAVILSNTIFHIARHPKAWRKIREEVLHTDSKPLTYELLNSLKYLNNTIKESLRLTPFATLNMRICLQDTILPVGGGINGKEPLYVQKGDVVETGFYAMHRDKDLWGPDAEQFKPERWERAYPTWGYLPFNGGPRTCPAQQMVYTESAYVITRLAREFALLENRDSCLEWKEEMRLNFQSKNGVQVAMTAA